MTVLATLGRHAFRFSGMRRAALAAAAMRGHGLVLVFHRISGEAPRRALVPSVPESLFRRQVEALLDAGEIVPLEALLEPSTDRRRPRLALTFDDDWPTHYDRALPVLLSLGVTATFFLSGRSIHGLGPLWFERLDRLVAAGGIRSAARCMGIDTDDPERLALACENDPLLQKRIEGVFKEEVPHLSRGAIGALASAGMTIGFHTLHHPLLSLVPDSALDEAVTRGRAELERVAGRPIRLFAYPHGKADRRVAERLRRAGFVAACTGQPNAVRPGDDPYRLGRWEPGPISIDRLVAGVAARLSDWRRHE